MLLLMIPFPISALCSLPLIFVTDVKPKLPRHLGFLACFPLTLPLDKEDACFLFSLILRASYFLRMHKGAHNAAETANPTTIHVDH